MIIEILQQRLQEQSLLIKKLTARIEELENNQKKDSSNSSKPPSSDIGKVKRTKSLRKASGKKPGGQPGHEGRRLEMSANPDKIEVCKAGVCSCCGKGLGKVQSFDYEARQVHDLPALRMLVTEHRSEIKSCPDCGTINRGRFPEGIMQQVQYGPEVQKMAVYFSNYQLLPVKRTAELFEDLFGQRVSEGSLVNINQRCADRLAPFIGDLKEELSGQEVLHADETGYYYKGARNWLHTLATEKHTLYVPHPTRGREAIDAMGVLPGYKGTLVHDFWKPYLEFGCYHSLCNIHHVRDLTFCEEMEHSRWATEMKQYLLSAYKAVARAKEAGKTALSQAQLYYWYKKYDVLNQAGWKQHPPPRKQKGKRGVVKKTKTQNMLQRFVQFKSSVLAFISDFRIPFGNNIAEQAIRMMKVKQKISGCFRSEQGATAFAIIRSYISTMQKQGIPILQALKHAILGTPIPLKA